MADHENGTDFTMSTTAGQGSASGWSVRPTEDGWAWTAFAAGRGTWNGTCPTKREAEVRAGMAMDDLRRS